MMSNLTDKDIKKNLFDHSCDGLKSLVAKGLFGYHGPVCDCSPCERNYYIKIGDDWEYVKFCPFCGSRMKSLMMDAGNPTITISGGNVKWMESNTTADDRTTDVTIYPYYSGGYWITCNGCQGKGWIENSKGEIHKCIICNGTGKIWTWDYTYYPRPCEPFWSPWGPYY